MENLSPWRHSRTWKTCQLLRVMNGTGLPRGQSGRLPGWGCGAQGGPRLGILSCDLEPLGTTPTQASSSLPRDLRGRGQRLTQRKCCLLCPKYCTSQVHLAALSLDRPNLGTFAQLNWQPSPATPQELLDILAKFENCSIISIIEIFQLEENN